MPPTCVLFLLAFATAVSANPPTGSITRHVWTNVGGAAITDLTSLTTFPNSPSTSSNLGSFLAPTNAGDSYGQRVFGWVHAPVTGNYIFSIHADDNAELWLSTSVSPDHKVRIASVPEWTNAGDWTKFPQQTSVSIPLQAGRYYYIEALHKEGQGGDNLGVGWAYPGQARVVIPGAALSQWQNLAPTATNDSAIVNVGGTVGIYVLENDLDPNGSSNLNLSSLQIISQPTQGSITIDTANRVIRYTHLGSAAGADSFTYQIQDAAGLAGTAQVNVTISNHSRLPLVSSRMPPQAPPQSIAVVDAFPGLTFSGPLGIVTPPGETQRIFVLEKGGQIRVIPNLTAPTNSPFLDLNTLVNGRAGEAFRTTSEQGLLGLAFHPQYASNGRFFVVYSVAVNGLDHQRLSEFAVSSTNPNQANTASEKVLIQQRNEAPNHNGGDLHFGADGYLYMSWGDEGNSDDSLNNSQTITKDFWSSITRIDIDLEAMDYTPNDGSAGDDANVRPNPHPAIRLDTSGNPRYEVPADNPWVGATQFLGSNINATLVRSEFWAVGLRNPWRMSFDSVTGTLWCGDVGQGAREEINKIVRGGNYEWAFKEGLINGVKWNSRPSGWTGSHPPRWDYTHGSGTLQGASVTGGLVYRGSRVASLTGRYIFADYVSGNIWSLNDSTNPPVVERIAGDGGIAGFGTDPSNGDVLMANISTGQIRRLVSQSATAGFPTTLAATGLFADPVALTPNPGLVAYQVNLPFWSDHAEKLRWFGIPETTSKIGFNREGAWNTPAGMIWVKHFDLETVRGNPASTKKRLETRVMVRNSTGSYGVSYRWNEAGTVATLADAGGEEFDVTVQENGNANTQRWQIPSQAQCITCHSPQAGHSLSFRTRQLNRSGSLAGQNGNFIQLLADAHYLENLDTPPNLLPRHVSPDESAFALEERARAYLEVNCSYCHSSGGSVPAQWDAGAALPLFGTGMVNGVAGGGTFHPDDRLLVPGQEQRSIILNRAAARNGYSRMPPLGSNVVDGAGVALLQEWIQQELPQRKSYAMWRESFFGVPPGTGGDPLIDSDLDGRSNQQEFLAGTHPLLPDRAPSVMITAAAGWADLTLPVIPGRSILLESSSNLQTWSLWEANSNQGLQMASTTATEFAIPASPPARFFRAKIEER